MKFGQKQRNLRYGLKTRGRIVVQLGYVIGEDVKDDPQIVSLNVSENGGTDNVE